MKHYKYGASTIARTIECPAWRGAAERMPPPGDPSDAAALGSTLHAAMETLAETWPFRDPDELVGQEILGITITQEHVDEKLRPACKETEALFDRLDVEAWETELPVKLNDKVGTTIDVSATSKFGPVVIDYKFGEGHQVSAANNPQLKMGAALALWGEHEFTDLKALYEGQRVYTAIIQPNGRGAPTVRLYDYAVEEIMDFQNELTAAVTRAEECDLDEARNYMPGDHCRFCPVAPVCPGLHSEATKVLRFDPDAPELERLAEILNIAKRLEDQIAAARKLAHKQLELGVKVPGWKLVDKRAYRKWIDPEEAEKFIRKSRRYVNAEFFNEVLVSPAQAEKLCKKLGLDYEPIDKLSFKSSSGTTLASEDDPRDEHLNLDIVAEVTRAITADV